MPSKLLHGIDCLADVLRGRKKILLVCGRSYNHLDIKEVIDRLEIPVVKFDQFTSNPFYEDVCRGVSFFNREGCDTILAVGGGSAIDVAKCIKLYCKMASDRSYLEQPYVDTGVNLIAIPTTAGSGSEMTRFAVIYYGGKKQSITHDSIVPNIVILEPGVLKKLPEYQKKCTMMDALCQGIESWWSVNSTDESKQYSTIAVDLILKYWQSYIFHNDEVAAEQIMLASNYAGRAINITQTTAPHAFSYKLTSSFGLPHGHAVAVCLPMIWSYMIDHYDRCLEKRGVAYLQQVFHDISASFGCDTPVEAIVKLQHMLQALQLMPPHSNNKEHDLHMLSESVNAERLKNNPVRLDTSAIYSLYSEILK